MRKNFMVGLVSGALMLAFSGLVAPLDAMSRRPPGPGRGPIGMPEASTLGLLGVGVAGVATYFIVKVRKKK